MTIAFYKFVAVESNDHSKVINGFPKLAEAWTYGTRLMLISAGSIIPGYSFSLCGAQYSTIICLRLL